MKDTKARFETAVETKETFFALFPTYFHPGILILRNYNEYWQERSFDRNKCGDDNLLAECIICSLKSFLRR